ncbi:hypothetical protein [Oceanospirillum beijerinckii]|uniref:hypothetical protein n=1 Tax=Oceanospirillum beijerinckii TaxID=64976 RepID=UPI0004207FF9|nr:hypothetical protein [Oceanospirillum beijerinckii]MAC45524.1 hypothetical protein [Oceanospirillum sp.]
MKRLLTTVALLGACLPAYAETSANSGYQLPADTVLRVQVLVDKTVNNGESISHLLLKATGSETGAYLPERCLMSANAEINNQQLEVSVNRALCVEPNGDIFDGAMNARIVDQNHDFGLAEACSGNTCTLQAGHDYTLRLLDSANIGLVVNQTEQINIQRRNHQPDSNSQQ